MRVPFTRPGEALEVAPGLIVTQHSGEGKANQYFLRGYNLDHGTDLAITLDDMPVNMRTHAHGQGYADLNFLIPELIGALNVRKGPYYADVGDFGSVGALSIGLVNSVDKKVAQFTTGSFGYERFLGYGSTALYGGNLLYAGEVATYNGPWSNPDDMRKLNGLLRFSQGTLDNGFTLTGMAYDNKWNSTDQVPLRAINSGQLGLYDAFDPSDGGNSSRFSLSARMAETDDAGAWHSNVYAIKSKLDLYNNFTYFLSDPVNGDQFHQHDDRTLVGGSVSRMIRGSVAGLPMETTFGLQTRYDNIDVALTDTVQRQFLSNVRTDGVKEGSAGIYAENVIHWTDWLRTIVGWRGDLYTANVNSIYDPANSGNAKTAIGSPKFSMVLGPFYKTEFFLSAGMGFHSNDARGVTITEDPTDSTNKLYRLAIPRAHQGRRSRRAHQDRAGPQQLGQRVRARSGLGDFVLGRCRRHRAEPAERTHRHRMDQRLPAGVVAQHRCRSGDDARALRRRLRYRAAGISTTRSPGSRRRRSATRRAITFPARPTWWRRPASSLARRPAGSAG